MAPAGTEPTKEVAALAAGLTALAEKLFQLDTLPELALAKGIGVYAADAADTAELRQGMDELSRRGAVVELGRIDVDKLLNVDAVVVSPGIPPQAPPFNDPRMARVKRISEIEFASRFLTARIIAITGTNGKSTTTALAGHLLQVGGVSSAVAGNIGNALSNVALLEQQPTWVVVEVSSFQLADIDRFSPVIGAVTNLAPDHLDRYASVEQYYADKANIFRHAGIDKIWVLNGDDPEVLKLANDAAGRRLLFKTSEPLQEGVIGMIGQPWVDHLETAFPQPLGEHLRPATVLGDPHSQVRYPQLQLEGHRRVHGRPQQHQRPVVHIHQARDELAAAADGAGDDVRSAAHELRQAVNDDVGAPLGR